MRAALALLATILSGRALATPAPRLIDYLYIEANEGGSSGGHVAIRFGDETYHFQHEPSGLLRLRRDRSTDFRYRYGVLGNRTIHESRFAAAEAVYARLRWQFAERFFAERAIFARRDALHEDRELLALLAARDREGATPVVRLRGAGLFFPSTGDSLPSPVLSALRARVEQTYGAGFVDRRAGEVKEDLARITPRAQPEEAGLGDSAYPQFPETFGARYRTLLTEIAALEVLEHARPLRTEARRIVRGPDGALDDTERAHLKVAAERLAEGIVRLVGSKRPDRGFALLVGMARLEALRESERTGRLVVVDAFPPTAEVMHAPQRDHADALRGLLVEAHAELAEIRARVRTRSDLDESGVAALESAGNRVVELDASIEGADLRVSGEPLLPALEAAWSELVPPDAPRDVLARAAAGAHVAERRYDDELGRRYGYDLFSRNCVSELIATVEQAEVDLGARLSGRWPLDVVPFVSAQAVDATWPVVERTMEPAYRRARLEEAAAREGRLRAWLRESNVLTSTIYHRNPDDSFFVFFTDDVVVPRPLFGSVNAVAALGASALGIVFAPFDGGHTFLSGVRGFVFSLPELVFVNLRKGTFDYVAGDGGPGARANGPL